MATRICNAERNQSQSGTALLSVHSDDVSLAIDELKRRFPRPWTLITVFSRSLFARRQPRDGDVLGAREREDHIYCEREGLAYRGLGFEDEPGIADSDSDARAQLSNAVRVELRCLLDDLGPEFVLAPFAVRRGARNHIHHSIVSDAAIDVMRSRKRAILGLFDEVCYSRLPLNEIPRVNGEAYIPHLVPLSERALHRKLESMRIYSTQNLSRFDRAVRAAEGEVVRLPCNGFHPQAGEPSARAGTDLEPSVATVAPRVLTGLCIEGLMGMGAAKPARAGVGS